MNVKYAKDLLKRGRWDTSHDADQGIAALEYLLAELARLQELQKKKL